MSNPIWPETLPQSLESDGYSETAPENVEFSQKTNPPIARQKYLGGVYRIKGAMRMTLDQYRLFAEFHRDVLRGGVLKFTGRLAGEPEAQTYHMLPAWSAVPAGPMHMTVSVELLRY